MADLQNNTDSLGARVKEGDVIIYAVTAGRSAVIKYAVVLADPAPNGRGVMKMSIRTLYSPSSPRPYKPPETTRKTSIECGARVYVTGLSVATATRLARAKDAELRLARGR